MPFGLLAPRIHALFERLKVKKAQPHLHTKYDVDVPLPAGTKPPRVEPNITFFEADENGFHAETIEEKGSPLWRLGAAFVDGFRAAGALNVLEIKYFSEEVPRDRFTLTIQRVAGKTPMDLVGEATAKLAAANAEIIRLGGTPVV